MHPPPHQCKANGFGRKITLNFGEDLFFFLFWRPPDFGQKKRSKNHSQFRWKPCFFCFFFVFFLETTWFWAEKMFEFPISAEKSLSISVKTLFFFFYFGDHLILGGKNVRKITLNFGEDLFFFYFGDHLILGGKNVRKITLNFGEDLFFFILETTWFWAEKTFEKSLSILVKTFFFFILETTWFWAEKTFEKSLSISVKTFFFLFWRPPDFGRKKRSNFRFRPKNHSQFRWRPFFFFYFGDHLILGGKNVRKITLSFGEDLVFFLETTWFWAEKTFEFPISAEKSLSISVKTSEFLRVCA